MTETSKTQTVDIDKAIVQKEFMIAKEREAQGWRDRALILAQENQSLKTRIIEMEARIAALEPAQVEESAHDA